MQKLVMDYLNEWKKKQRKRRRTGIVAALLVVMVAGGIISSLTEAGIAMTGDVKCGKDEHQHTDECCESVLVCGQEETEGHQHSEDCYQTESVLSCSQEESEEHQHTEECYSAEQTLICGQEESAGHIHSKDCFQEHLTCDKEEHSHSEICYIDENAGVEDASVWDAQYADTQWTESWNENLVIAAKKQLGYEEVEENYITTEDGERKGYTRYGQFAGNAYMDWDAAFVNFCVYYSQIAESALFPGETDSGRWLDEFVSIHEENRATLKGWEELGTDTPETGDIIFFQREGEETGTQMGIVSSYNMENNQIQVIEGNCENGVRENTYDAGDERITTYLKTAELERMYKGIGSEEAEEIPGKTESDDLKETEPEESPKEEKGDVIDGEAEETPEEPDSESADDGKAGEASEEPDSEEADDSKAGEASEEPDSEGIADTKEEDVPKRTAAKNKKESGVILGKAEVENEKQSKKESVLGEADFRDMKDAGVKTLLGETNSEVREHDSERSQDEWTAQIKPDPGSDGRIVLELLYGDDQRHDAYCPTCYSGDDTKRPDVEGTQVRPDLRSNGYMKLTTDGILGDTNLPPVSITIHIPADYIKETNKEGEQVIGFGAIKEIEGRPLPKTEVAKTADGKYYEFTMNFENFSPTDAAIYEFHWEHLGENIPADYQERIYATLRCGEQKDTTYENVYRPLYDEPEIIKYVNSNQYDSMSWDGTKVSVMGSKDEGIIDANYVSFWYKLGGHSNWVREYQKIILTDTLPTYQRYKVDENGNYVVDKDGNKVTEEARAVFDENANPGWQLSEDKTTVTRTFTTDKTCANPGTGNMAAVDELKEQIEAAELKLRFPYCIMDEEEILDEATGQTNPFLTKRLTNHVSAECVPSNPSADEQSDIVKDTIDFVLTTQRPGSGFGKSNSYNVITDTKQMRSTPYRWEIILENTESVSPMREITIEDYELDQFKVKDNTAEGGERLDERDRLKIYSIQILEAFNGKGERIDAKDRVDYIEAFPAEGEPDEYSGEAFKDRPYDWDWGWYEELVFDSDKEYERFVIHMKPEYVLNRGEKIDVRVYTTFKDPEKPHYDENNPSRNIYHNGAKAQYWIDNVFYTGFGENHFELERATENIWIEKKAYLFDKENLSLDYKGDCYWLLTIKGMLAEKNYEDLRIVDLLPESLTSNGDVGTGGDYITKTEVIENYKGTNRTAIISYLNAEKLKEALQVKVETVTGEIDYNEVKITYKTKVRENAPLGTDYNEVFLLSDEFDPITNQHSAMDKYDLDDDGDREEFHRFARDYCTVIAQRTIRAEKWIAPEQGDNWSIKDALKMGVGDKFRYKLQIFNGAGAQATGLVVYDVLPNVNDKTINNEAYRNSEYRVVLSDYLEFGGYTVYYTNSDLVYQLDMAGAVSTKENSGSADTGNSVPWYTKEQIGENEPIENLEDVTAIKIAANPGLVIASNAKAEFDIPVKAALADSSRAILENKETEDAQSGIVTYLDAKNTFGYQTASFSGSNLESNSVISKIPFAGFVVKKTEAGKTDNALSGAEFKLEKKITESVALDANSNPEPEEDVNSEEGQWEEVEKYKSVITGENGLMEFKNLEEGTYRLTEVNAPEGYLLLKQPMIIEIKLNRNLMEYSVKMTCEGVSNGHAGNNQDPFIVENLPLYTLPSAGGIGIYWYMFGGVLLMMAAALITYRKTRKGVLES